MDELKELVGMVQQVPETALWILGGFAFYKLFIFGSVVGAVQSILKLAITKWHHFKTTPVELPPQKVSIDHLVITHDGSKDMLLAQLTRLIGKRVGIGTGYIHSASVEWLREAIDEKEIADREEKAGIK